MSEKWDREVDVVCVGSGIGGSSAAIAAASAGASVLIVEKTDKLGGVTAFSGGIIWIPGNHYAKELGISDTLEDGVTYITALAAPRGNPERTKELFVKAAEALDFYESRSGVRFDVIRGMPDYFHTNSTPGSIVEGRTMTASPFDARKLGTWRESLRRSPRTMSFDAVGAEGDDGDADVVFAGVALAGQFLLGAISEGCEIWTESPAVRLIREGNEVVGVEVSDHGDSKKIRAKHAVILAAGGYDRNEELLARHEGSLPAAQTMVPPGIDGDALHLAGESGAAIASLPPQHVTIQTGFPTGQTDERGQPLYDMYMPLSPHEIVVNQGGRRFTDESFYPALEAAFHVVDGTTSTTPNWPAWLIFDQNYLDQAKAAEAALLEEGKDSGLGRPFFPPPEDVHVSADSIEDLALKIGVDAQGLEATIERYNGFCAQDRDDDFHRGEHPWTLSLIGKDESTSPNPMLGPIDKPPFRAAPLTRVMMGMGTTGVRVNECAQALDHRGQPIQGLYAVGNSAAREEVGFSFQGGLANTRGFTFGYIAGRHAAQNTR